jgi:PAS domain S-box-containing protein
LFDSLAVVFATPRRSARARAALRAAVGDTVFEQFLALLGYVRTAHYWTETHPEIEPEPELVARLSEHPELARVLLEASAKEDTGVAEIQRRLDGAETALRDSAQHLAESMASLHRSEVAELRLQSLVEGIAQLVWRAGEGGHWSWSSPQWMAYTGLEGDDSVGLGWLGALHPSDRDLAMRCWDASLLSGHLETECRIYRAAIGDYRWFQMTATPVRGENGAVVEWLGTFNDVHDMRDLQDRQRVLVAELQHRTRNLMGVVRSIADTTVRASSDLGDFRDRFRDRLDALARVQQLLSRMNEHDRVTFDELLRAELSAMGADTERVQVRGPGGVRLRSSTVQTLAMALHELATNAVKYGALGQASGHLSITWSYEPTGLGGAPWLHIDWRETGVRIPPEAPARAGSGQGRELIEHALPYQLRARTSFVIRRDGAHCMMSIPVSGSVGARGDPPP